MLSDQWLLGCVLDCHLLELLEALLKLLPSWWVLSNSCDQLHGVQLGLFVKVVEELNDLIEHVEIVDLNLAFLQLGQGGESSHS